MNFGFRSNVPIVSDCVAWVPSVAPASVPLRPDALIVGGECAPFFYLRSIRLGNRSFDLNAPASAFTDRLCDQCGIVGRRKAETMLSKILICPGEYGAIEVEHIGAPASHTFVAFLRCAQVAWGERAYRPLADALRLPVSTDTVAIDTVGQLRLATCCRQCGVEGLAEEPAPTDEERARRAYLNARKMLAGLSPEARARVLDEKP